MQKSRSGNTAVVHFPAEVQLPLPSHVIPHGAGRQLLRLASQSMRGIGAVSPLLLLWSNASYKLPERPRVQHTNASKMARLPLCPPYRYRVTPRQFGTKNTFRSDLPHISTGAIYGRTLSRSLLDWRFFTCRLTPQLILTSRLATTLHNRSYLVGSACCGIPRTRNITAA